ncbi:hypothetical protein Taro_052989, partial [Colocasia esculenta]|nr:hypothetical protein [Colocasia esculenta]
VASVAWNPHPWEPVEGVLQATSVLELAADRADSGAEGKTSPLSHCLSLRWFRSHIVVSSVSPPLGQVAVLRVLCVSAAALSRPCAGAEAAARLASRACGPRVPHLAASGGGLVAVAVTTFPHDVSKPVLLVVPGSVFSRFRGPVLGCQPVMAPACVASRPGGVSGVRGGVLSTVSALCPTLLVSAGVVCVARPRLVVMALRYFLLLRPVRDWCAASLHDSCACCSELQLLMCYVRGECGRSACSCCSGAVGVGLTDSSLPLMEDTSRQVQVRCSWSSSAQLSMCALRRLKEPACGVAFTSAELWSVEPVPCVLCCTAGRALQHLPVVVVGLVLASCELWLRCIAWLPCVLVRAVPWWFWWRFSQDRFALPLQFARYSVLFDVCRLVGLRSGEVLPGRFLALLVEILPKAAFQGVVRLAVRLAAALASLSRCSFPSFSVALAGLCVSPWLGWFVLFLRLACSRRLWSVAMEVVLLALARQGVVVVFAPRVAESVLRVSCGESFLLSRIVVSAASAPVLHLAEFWCLCTLCCAIYLFVYFVRCFTSLLGVEGVALSVVRQALVVACVRVSLSLWERVRSVVVPCFDLGPSEVDVLSSTSAVVLVSIWLRVVLTTREVWVRPSGDSGCRFRMFRFLRVHFLSLLDSEEATVCSVGFFWQQSELPTSVSCVAVGNCVLCRVLLATEWVADRLVPTARSVGGCSRVVFGWRFPLFSLDLASLGIGGVVVLFGHPTCGWSELSVPRFSAPEVLEHVGGPSHSGCRGLKVLAGYPFPLSLFFFPSPSPSGDLFLPFVCFRRGGGPCVVSRCLGACVERGGSVHSYEKGPTGFSLRLSRPTRRDISRGVTPVGHNLIAARLAAAIRVAVATWFPVATGRLSRRTALLRQGCCRDALPCRDVIRRGFVVLPRLFARCLALEGLSHSEVVSVAWDPHPREPVEGVLRATSVLELAADRVDSGAEGKMRPVLLVVPASVFSRFRGLILGCQPVMAPACVASRPSGVSEVQDGVLSTISALCPTPLVSVGVVCVARPRLVVVALPFPAAPAGEGLVIPTGPCSRGSPPYFLQLGARRRGSSVSDGLRGGGCGTVLLSAAVRASVVSSSSRVGSLHFCSLFTMEILEARVSPKLPLPTIAPYDGTTDPADHIHGFELHMVFHGASDAVKCRAFPATLKETARAWFEALPARSISSFHQLKKSFRDNFLGGRSQPRTTTSLLSVRQKKGEAL